MAADAIDDGAANLRRRLSRGLLGASLGLFAVLFLLGLDSRSAATFEQGEPLPAFDLELLSGGHVLNSDLSGRVVVINVWASWCPPCRAEAPVLRRVDAAADPDRVVFLGVARDNNPDDSRDFLEEHGITFLNAIDGGSFARALRVSGLPTTFVIDASGGIVARHFGPISESKLTALIADAVARGEAPEE